MKGERELTTLNFNRGNEVSLALEELASLLADYNGHLVNRRHIHTYILKHLKTDDIQQRREEILAAEGILNTFKKLLNKEETYRKSQAQLSRKRKASTIAENVRKRNADWKESFNPYNQFTFSIPSEPEPIDKQ
jgi:hypothetical protein